METFLFTSESVNEGHPDKLCDQISDAIIDACLSQDPDSKVACETCTRTNMVMVFGEITTKANIDYEKIVCDTCRNIGFVSADVGLDADNYKVLVNIEQHSPDIAQGVHGHLTKRPEDISAVYGSRSGLRLTTSFSLECEANHLKWNIRDQAKKADSPCTSENDPKTWHVQVFRSINSSSVKGFPDGPKNATNKNLVCGKNPLIDMSIHTAYVNAIGASQHFIYIENQYFLGSSFNWAHHKYLGEEHQLLFLVSADSSKLSTTQNEGCAYIAQLIVKLHNKISK